MKPAKAMRLRSVLTALGSGNIYAEEGNHWDALHCDCGGC